MLSELPPRPSADIHHLRFPPRGPDNGGNPPGGDDMEKRVQELEKNFLQAAISLATIRTKLDTLPDKDWVTTRIFWAVGAFAGVAGLIAVIQTLVLKQP